HNQRDKRYFDIYRVDVATGDSRLLYQNDQFTWNFTDPQFGVRWGIKYRDDGGWDVLNAGGDNAGSLLRPMEAGEAFSTGVVEIGDDGREPWWLASHGRARAAVVAQALASGRFRVLAEDASADFDRPVLDPVTCAPLVAPVVHTTRRW